MASCRSMVFDRFQAWSRTAPAAKRVDGVRILAKAILKGDLGASRRDAIAVLTGFLDDPSPVVRMALAEAVAAHPRAPHHLVLALTDDHPAIAAVVLARSPVLSEAVLIDCAATASPVALAAIAGRHGLTPAVMAALVEVADPVALATLAGNRDAVLPAATLRRMVERGNDDAALREALLSRGSLPPDVRIALVAGASRCLAAMVAERGWLGDGRMDRIAAEARDRATVTVGADLDDPALAALAAHLRLAGRLTPGLALRALLSGRRDLFAAALRELTGAPAARIGAALRDCGGVGFAALYRDAGLPAPLLPTFRAAVRAAADIGSGDGTALSLNAVERVINASEGLANEGLKAGASGGVVPEALLIMLRRFEAEAARDEARLLDAASTARSDRPGDALTLFERDAAATRPARDRRPRYTIDLAAIEAQLLAA